MDKRQWPVTGSGKLKGWDVLIMAEFVESHVKTWKDPTGSCLHPLIWTTSQSLIKDHLNKDDL